MSNTRKSNGRKSEHKIFTELVKAKPKFYIYRFNENRFQATPADIYVSTSQMDVLIEVKSTIRKFIQKGNLRKSQIESLRKFDRVGKKNLAVVWLCYKGPKHVIVNINKINKFSSKINFNEACKIGTEVKEWKNILAYFKKELA